MTSSGARRSPRQGRGGPRVPPTPEQMDLLLRRCGIYLSKLQGRQLWEYHQLLRRHNAELNLTRIRNFENMVRKLYADAMLPALHTILPSPLLDLGTGPGMPGIPLKIFRPQLHILLAESRRQRIEFLKKAVDTLGLPGLEVVDRGIAPDYDRPVAGIITRAVEPITATLARVSGCLVNSGRVIFMKGPHCDDEIESAAGRFAQQYALVENVPYRIPHTPHRRRLVTFQRVSEPIRRNGSAAKGDRYRPHVIESRSNAVFKELKKLLSGRGVKKQGRTLVCGSRLTAEAIAQRPDNCLAWITGGDRDLPPDDAPAGITWFQLTPDLFREIDLFGSRRPIILYETPEIAAWKTEEASLSGCHLLIPFQDPENVGAVIRSAVAFGVDRLVLLAESANPFHPKAVRASAGTVFSANLFQGPSLNAIPRTLPIVALSSTGRPLSGFRFPATFCLLAGMEGPGLPPGWETDSLAIPMAHGVESLNASVAVAVALYEWQRTGRRAD